MQTFFLFALIILSVIVMVIAISKFHLHPFIVLTVIAMAVGLIWGIDPEEVVNTVKSGFGSIMTSIGIVILCGTIIGTILEKTGAALTMANFILKIVGKKNSVLAMGAMGYVTGIPVFCDSGFVVLSPISRALAEQSHISLAVMGTALSGGLYATHCLVPPTPGPIAMAGTLLRSYDFSWSACVYSSCNCIDSVCIKDFQQSTNSSKFRVYIRRTPGKIW